MLTGLVALLGLSGLQPAPAQAWVTAGCRQYSQELRKNKKHRAIAVSRKLDTEYCGGTWGEPSREVAIQRALQACRQIGSRTCTIVWAE
jgi:hypothetical protein